MIKKKLDIGTKIYSLAWDTKGNPVICNDEITGYKYTKEGCFLLYLTKKGAFSKGLLGKSYFLTREEAKLEHEKVKNKHPYGLSILDLYKFK